MQDLGIPAPSGFSSPAIAPAYVHAGTIGAGEPLTKRKPGRPKGPVDYLGRPVRCVLVWAGTDGYGGHGPIIERFHDETAALGLVVALARNGCGMTGLQALRRTVKGWERV